MIQNQKQFPLIHLLLDDDKIVHVMIPDVCEKSYSLDQIDDLGEFLYLIGAENLMPQLKVNEKMTLKANAAMPDYFYNTEKYLAMPEYP